MRSYEIWLGSRWELRDKSADTDAQAASVYGRTLSRMPEPGDRLQGFIAEPNRCRALSYSRRRQGGLVGSGIERRTVSQDAAPGVTRSANFA